MLNEEIYHASLTCRNRMRIGQEEIKPRLESRQESLNLFNETCFASFLNIKAGQNDPLLIHYLLCTQVHVGKNEYETLQFNVAGNPVSFGRREFCLLTGFRFGPYTLDDLAPDTPFMRRVFNEQISSRLRVGHICRLWDSETNFNNLGDDDVVRVALLYMLYKGFIGAKPEWFVATGLIHLLEDIPRSWNRFAWGSYLWTYTYDKLYDAINERRIQIAAVRTAENGVPKYTIYGPIWVLKCWIFVTFPAVTRVISNDGSIPRCGAIGKYPGRLYSNELTNIFAKCSEPGYAPMYLTPTDCEQSQRWWVASLPFFEGGDGVEVPGHEEERAPTPQFHMNTPERSPPNEGIPVYGSDGLNVDAFNKLLARIEEQDQKLTLMQSIWCDTKEELNVLKEKYKFECAKREQLARMVESIQAQYTSHSGQLDGADTYQQQKEPMSMPHQTAPTSLVGECSTSGNVPIAQRRQQLQTRPAATLEQLHGTHAGSFSDLPGYCHYLKLANPGTVTEILTDDCSRFEMLFVALGPSLRSFSYNLRPLIIVDAAHLKGTYLGTNFLAVAMDGNNQILPLAYGIGKTESGKSWTWFLEKLRACIPYKTYTFVSDRAASIELAIRDVFPESFHVLCCRHLQTNLNLRANKHKKNTFLFWKACKSYTQHEFHYWYGKIQRAAPRVYEYLEEVEKSKWTRACFSGHRYNIMTSNSAESINSLSRHARKLPVVMLIDFFRTSVQNWFFKRRNEAEKLQHKVTPWAEKKIRHRMTKCSTWQVQGITNYRFQVEDHKKNINIVDTEEKTCDCRKWALSGLPCGHAIAVSRFLRLTDSSQWALNWFTSETYLATYSGCINPVPKKNMWDLPSDLINLHPPLLNKRQAGRPKLVKRIPPRGEQVPPTRCSSCGDSGHHRDNCRMPFSSQQSTNQTANASTAAEPNQPDLTQFEPDLSLYDVYYTVQRD